MGCPHVLPELSKDSTLLETHTLEPHRSAVLQPQEMNYIIMGERVPSSDHGVVQDWVIVLKVSVAELLADRKGSDE